MRKITGIVIHCSATPEGKAFTAKDIDGWHKKQGWQGIGYHYVVKLDGAVEKGRPDEAIGSHVAGHNGNTIGVCYIGGLDASGKKAKDTRTAAQKASLLALVRDLKEQHPQAKVLGHRDFPGVKKDCPSFSVADWLAAEGV